MKLQKYRHLSARIEINLGIAAAHLSRGWFILLPAILGLLSAIKNRQWPKEFIILAPLGLAWLPFFGLPRFLASLFCALCLLASSMSLPVRQFHLRLLALPPRLLAALRKPSTLGEKS